MRRCWASKLAWEAYRDTECQTRAIVAGAGAETDGLELACAIELTRERIDALLRVAARSGG